MKTDQQPVNAEVIVFDLDGTLIDSMADIAAAINRGVLAIDGQMIDVTRILPLIGQPLSDMYQRLLVHPDAAAVERACRIYREYYYTHCAERTRLYPGVAEGLEHLSHLTLAVATTKKTSQAERVVAEIGIADHFAVVQGTDGFAHKPDPSVIYRVRDQLELPEFRGWMVGDTVYDIQAGKAAGLKTCAVTYGIGQIADLAAAEPDLTVDSLVEFAARLHNDHGDKNG